ncbi:astacin-like metalloendopeptidase [Synchiropus splendidus]|uniref:astacin-like metalloendopeptidase n=1 Tax=Synchiropus splendidus TaxID=270530 RepID=UPI00237E1E93|nr:astacin-like metalloendopeptidase [Synchiropus splendidus]
MLLLLAALLFCDDPQHAECVPLRESGRDWLVRAQSYMTSDPETVEELTADDMTVLEGDLVLSTDRNAVNNRWPTSSIPYAIDATLEGRTNDIEAAMAMVSEETCLTFHLRTSEPDYLLFQTSKGCASYVGFIGGKQPVFVGPQCRVGNIIHEILHAAGFHHEHTRQDREKFISIQTGNIMQGMEKNFNKRSGATFELPYDITSILHYGSHFFSVNGQPTIVPNESVKGMGQRRKMTPLDVAKVRQLYKCDPAEADGSR